MPSEPALPFRRHSRQGNTLCQNTAPKPPPTAAIWRAHRALCRATDVMETDFGKPIIAVANTFNPPVPGHVHLHKMGQLVARETEKAGAIVNEFHTIAIERT